jgi:hypothetical protein
MDEKRLDVETTHAGDEHHGTKFDIPEVTWWKEPGLRHLYLMMPILFLGSTINGYDGSLLNGLQTMEQWRSYFGYPTGAELGLFTAIQNVGAVCALPFSSYLADLFGRRIGVEVGIFMVFVGVIVQSVPAVTEGMFIGGRFLVGFGSNLSQGSAPLLIMEVCRSPPDTFGLFADIRSSLPIPNTVVRSRRCTTPCGTSARSSPPGLCLAPSGTVAKLLGECQSRCKRSCRSFSLLESGCCPRARGGSAQRIERKML